MTTRQFLQTAAAAFLLFVTSVFFTPNLQAQCDCLNTVNVDATAQCCVFENTLSVICGDGNTYSAFPSAGPNDVICRGRSAQFRCPCPAGAGSIQAFIIAGHTISVGHSANILYGGDCCLNVSVVQNSNGCITVNISAGNCSCNCDNLISLDAALGCCILETDILVNCNDGTTNPAFPNAQPGDQLCAGDAVSFPCPCTSGIASINIGGNTIPIGGNTQITYGNCCMNVTVTQNADGCLTIQISPCSTSCDCTNTISLADDVPCCIYKKDISMECSDGTSSPAFPGVDPTETICRGSGPVTFRCHCQGSVDGIIIGGTTIPAGSSGDILYGGDCCLHVTVTQRADGCIDVNVSRGTLCYLENVQPRHLMGDNSVSSHGSSMGLVGAR